MFDKEITSSNGYKYIVTQTSGYDFFLKTTG